MTGKLTDKIDEELDEKKIGEIELNRLNDSELRALKWLVEECCLDERLIRRKSEGVDFVYDGNIGIEVKLREPYSIRETQIKDSNKYDKVFVVVAKKGNVFVKDCIENIEWGNTDDLLTMGDVPEWKGDIIDLYELMQKGNRKWVPDHVNYKDMEDIRFYEKGYWTSEGKVILVKRAMDAIVGLYENDEGEMEPVWRLDEKGQWVGWVSGSGPSYEFRGHLNDFTVGGQSDEEDMDKISNKIIDVVSKTGRGIFDELGELGDNMNIQYDEIIRRYGQE